MSWPHRRRRIILALARLLLLAAAASPLGCAAPPGGRTVVLYTSVDQVFSEPVLARFEQESGIRVLAVYDVEAAKTTGLVNRLIAERERPQADVFWNGEFAQTLLLQRQGVLQPYLSPAAAQVPAAYRDPQGYWTGFGGRMRVIMVNTEAVAEADTPRSIDDLLSPRWPRGSVGLAYPLFGTTATHAAALYAARGPEEGRRYFERHRDQGSRIVDGNSVVRDLVASGALMAGLTDSDDACGALARGAPVAVIVPDQEGLGALVIPNTVGLIAGAPHPEAGRRLIDYLLSAEVDAALIEAGWSYLSLRGEVLSPECLRVDHVRGMDVDLAQVDAQMERAQRELREVLVR